MLFKSRLFQSLVLGIYIGGLYFDNGTQSYINILSWRSLTGLLFFLNISMMMQSLSPIAIVFPS